FRSLQGGLRVTYNIGRRFPADRARGVGFDTIARLLYMTDKCSETLKFERIGTVVGLLGWSERSRQSRGPDASGRPNDSSLSGTI
ncbi:MAG: hypothetical protein QGI88_03930, partial [SAR202 cluster bacterium]|nr:hypothetical protein [SAR202 cluster bacterium]